MLKPFVLSALAALGTAACSTVVREPSTITKAEARSLPPSEVKRRVIGQLGDILSEQRVTRRRPPVNPLTDMSFAAKPRSTAVPNLCRIDQLTITFQSNDGDLERGDANTPVSASGFTATTFFQFSRPPTGPYESVVDYDHSPGDPACRRAKLWEGEFFTADDDRVATDGYFLAHRVMDAIAGGAPAFALVCNKYPVETNRECADITREMKSAQIESIDRCEAEVSETASALCYEVFVGDRSLRIIASPYATGPNVRPPLTVLHVVLDSLIV